MSTLEDLDLQDREQRENNNQNNGGNNGDGDAEMKDVEAEKDDILDDDILNSSTRDIINRKRLLDNDMHVMKTEFQRLTHEKATMLERIKDNRDKIENNRYGSSVLCYMMSSGVPRRSS